MQTEVGTEVIELQSEAVATAKAEAVDRKKGKRLRIFEYDAAYLVIAMIIGAMIGFWAENIGRAVTRGVLDNRFMILPFIGAYGLAVFAMYLMIGTPDKMRFFNKRLFQKDTRANKVLSNVTYFLVVSAFVVIGEIGVGTIYEKLTGLALWDYSAIPLHLTKYTSLPTTILFGGGAYLAMKLGFTPFMDMMQHKMSYSSARGLAWSLGTLIAIDSVIMIVVTLVTKQPPIYWTMTIYWP